MFISTFIKSLWRKKRYTVLVLIGIFVLYYLVNKGAADTSKIKTYQVNKKDLKSEVIASGKIAAQNESTPVWAVMLGVGFSTLVGVVFGVAPAIRASRLQPIEALRHE